MTDAVAAPMKNGHAASVQLNLVERPSFMPQKISVPSFSEERISITETDTQIRGEKVGTLSNVRSK